MPSGITTHTLGLPRIGRNRELKKATESYWAGHLSRSDLFATGAALRADMWLMQREAGISLPSSNDFSFYDRMLDMMVLLGVIPPRFESCDLKGLDLYFTMARGIRKQERNVPALEMTKWFDTNYHYLVPEFDGKTRFSLQSEKPCSEFLEAKALGFVTKPILIGPVTFLRLGRPSAQASLDFDVLSLLDGLLPVYAELLHKLEACGAVYVEFDEPALALDLDERWMEALTRSYEYLNASRATSRLLLATYFGAPCMPISRLARLPVQGFHLDATRMDEKACLDLASRLADGDQILSLGVVDGRNVWRNRFSQWTGLLDSAYGLLHERLWLAPSCSLQHVPLSLDIERSMDRELKKWLSFAQEKLGEVGYLAHRLTGSHDASYGEENEKAWQERVHSPRIHKTEIHKRLESLQDRDFKRKSPFPIRQPLQQDLWRLPILPTTTIGSFPQTAEVRKARAQWKNGLLSAKAYEGFLREQTEACVRVQEEIGLDVLVHGEFERNDMVEYFGEQLDGFAFTSAGWVQSYGTRYVKPPILFGDVARKGPMTVRWSSYAQSLTAKPMKGMLTGPVTILQWSFVRNDQPRKDTAWQIALALRDEVEELEAAGIGVIQVDEPALREGLPLRRQEWPHYLDWAVAAFQLSVCTVQDATQIHTHMCYADFADIMEAIVALDADVITLEASRSGMQLLDSFVRHSYPNEIGPGIYDIHSPLVPGVDELSDRLALMLEFLPKERLWVNPDCGLKTRGWPETLQALRNMVNATVSLRCNLQNTGAFAQ